MGNKMNIDDAIKVFNSADENALRSVYNAVCAQLLELDRVKQRQRFEELHGVTDKVQRDFDAQMPDALIKRSDRELLPAWQIIVPGSDRVIRMWIVDENEAEVVPPVQTYSTTIFVGIENAVPLVKRFYELEQEINRVCIIPARNY